MDSEGAATLPAGTVTFLLTDVEGSSRLWEIAPEAASTALGRRQEIIRGATCRHGGVLPVEQGEGDSSVSAFARASNAASCAVDIQRLLGAEVWPTPAEIRVRIALHTGEAEPRPDGTYQGAVLNRCARLRSIGHGGQILLSQASYEVLVDGLADGCTVRDLGVYRLRDLARPENVWQLCHPDISDVFPPLRSLDAVANNLPAELTSFVGREAEIDAVRALIGEHRLVTLTGAGGSGKTRLALQLAAGVADGYPDGIWWIDLAPLADPALVPAALAHVLGVRESPLEPITDTVVRYLTTRRAFVGLDNCEHLIESCASLAARLIQDCPAVTLVATSRESLRVDGEATWPLAPLSLPDDDIDPAVDRCEAVQLFVDRARAAKPDFSLIPSNTPAVAQICTRLDGIPLAIELAAARIRVLTVEQIAAGLADRFHLLTGGARTALPRQRTLESSVDWSHDLLDDAERTVFRRLAVFAGSFTIEAAEVVCAGDGVAPQQVLDLVSGLAERSLVQIVDATRAQTRYRLLETIRDYARHKLTDAGEAEVTRERHLDHYLLFVEQAEEGLEGPALVDWLDRVDAELDNLRAALDWSGHSTEPARGLRVVSRLCLYWFARSELAVGRARLEATLEADSEAGPERGYALGTLSLIAYRAGDMAKARTFSDDAVEIGRGAGDARLLGRALHARAWVRFWGEADRAGGWADFDEAATLLGQTDDRVFTVLNLAVLAWACTFTHEAPRARALLDEALADAADVPHARCYSHLVLGQLEFLEGDLDRAAFHLEEALTLVDGIRDPYAEVFSRGIFAYTHVFRGRYEDARDQIERGLATALEHHSPNGECVMRWALGLLEFAEGNLDAAADEMEAAVGLIVRVFPALSAIPRAYQAQIALARSAHVDARQYAAEALRVGTESDTVFGVQFALVAQADLARLDGDPHTAEDLCHDALDLAHQLRFRLALCDVLDALGKAVACQDRAEEAARILGAAQRLRDALGAVRFPVLQPSHEAEVAAVRDALGEEAFDEAWAEGVALSLDDAVAYAQRGRGRRKRPGHGWPSLTPTEVQVVELVAEGLTNPQIGERLFISRRTVQTHLAHVFNKLGVSTRAELAAISAQRQTTQP